MMSIFSEALGSYDFPGDSHWRGEKNQGFKSRKVASATWVLRASEQIIGGIGGPARAKRGILDVMY